MAHLPQERLSVTLAREHVNDGHGGDYSHYCYRCQYFEQLREVAYWEWLALSRKHVWLAPGRQWWPLLRIGSDEFWRYTLCVGPVVVALWPMWTDRDRKSRLRWLREQLERDPGQRDRDGQGQS